MIPKPSKSSQNLLDDVNQLNIENERIKKRLKKIESKFQRLLDNIRPLRAIYHTDWGCPAGYNRHYHYKDAFINNHINNYHFADDGNIGYILTIDPDEL